MMGMDWPILSLTTFVPLIGAFAILLIRGTEGEVGAQCPLGSIVYLCCYVTFIRLYLAWF